MSEKHDEHYRGIEAAGVEPIAVLEMIVCQGLPPELHDIAKRNLSVALATKYLLRRGSKDEARKELDKAANYIHRARTGEWL